MMRRLIIGIVTLAVIIGVIGWFYFNPQSNVSRAAGGVVQQATDMTTSGKVKSAFALSKRLSAYEIGVDTKLGVVTLSGAVPSDIEKELAESVTKDTNGVSQVDNQLRVELGMKPSETSLREGARIADLEIRADLQERLAASPELKGKDIQVAVRDRVVTLSGKVETPAEKTGAEQLARSINNVANVVNELSIGNPNAPLSEVPGMPTKDGELARQVSFALFNERENFVNPGAIKVESRDGRVTLSGSVASRAERALAERVARDVKEAQSINNQLSVSSPN
jgi:hyperosmotically inducible protein